MRISRREFLQAATGMAGLLGLEASGIVKLQEALASPAGPTVIWLQGQGCTGCSVSLLNSVFYTTIDDLLVNTLNLEYHPNIMAAAGDRAMSAASGPRPSLSQFKTLCDEWFIQSPDMVLDLNADGKVNFTDYAMLAKSGFILVVEGAIPIGSSGLFCEIGGDMTMIEAMGKFGAAASQIIAVGACAAFGGIPAGVPNPTQALSVSGALAHLGITKPVINIAGCPIHPDWLVGTIVDLLTGQSVTLDAYKRPLKFFPEKKIHDSCPLKGTGEASALGMGGCLKQLACKGPKTHADCHVRKWNNAAKGQAGVNWCIAAGSPCIGCTEPTFPDGMSPFYRL